MFGLYIGLGIFGAGAAVLVVLFVASNHLAHPTDVMGLAAPMLLGLFLAAVGALVTVVSFIYVALR